MTVEQRITTQDSHEIEKREIKPGESIDISVRMIEKIHPHNEFDVTFRVECSKNDILGTVNFNHPSRGIVSEDFQGRSKYYLIRRDDGRLGKIEWEHTPGPNHQ